MYRGFIKEITNLSGLPIGNADLRVKTLHIRRDILTSASSDFEVLGIPEQAKVGNVFGCYDEYGKIIYLGIITSIDGKTIQANQIISLFNDNWLFNNPAKSTIEETVRTILVNDFQNNADTLMRTIYSQFDISIVSTGTAFTLPTHNANYVMNFMQFIFELYENYHILFDIDIKYNAVRPTLTILKPEYETLKLSDNNNALMNFHVVKETYETNKLILYSKDGVLRGTWYGTESGITNNSAADRLPKIKTKIVFSDDPAEDIIAENLSDEMYNHKIDVDLVLENRLYDFDDFKLGRAFDIYYDGNVYNSVLTGYDIQIDEDGKADIVNLVFGIVRISLTDKLNRVLNITNDLESVSGEGVTDYSELTAKPSINGVTLNGNLTSADLGITSAEIKIITGTLGNSADFTSLSYPSGFTASNCVVINWAVNTNDASNPAWATGHGLASGSDRTFVQQNSTNILFYNNQSAYYGKTVRVVLMKIS